MLHAACSVGWQCCLVLRWHRSGVLHSGSMHMEVCYVSSLIWLHLRAPANRDVAVAAGCSKCCPAQKQQISSVSLNRVKTSCDLPAHFPQSTAPDGQHIRPYQRLGAAAAARF
jgi:hypothetical protein